MSFSVLPIVLFISTIPVSIIMPMLPFLGEKYGASAFEVSLLFSLFPIISVIAAPFWGRMSDTIGRRPTLLLTLFGGSVAFIGFAISESLWALFLTRAFQGMFGGLIGVIYATLADTVRPEGRAKAFGRLSASMALGFMLGPVLGGVLLGSDAVNFDHQMPSLVASGLSFASFLLAFFFHKETLKRSTLPKAEQTKPPSTWSVVSNPRMFGMLSYFFIAGFTAGAVQLGFTLWGSMKAGFGPDIVAYTIGAFGLAFFLATSTIVGYLSKAYGDQTALLIGACVDFFGLCFFIFVGLGAPLLAGIGLFISSLGSGTWGTLNNSIVSANTSEHSQGTMLGIANSAGLVGRVAGPIIVGILFDLVSPTAPFVLCAALLLFVMVRASFVVRAARHPQPPVRP
jgi:MFS family permease